LVQISNHEYDAIFCNQALETPGENTATRLPLIFKIPRLAGGELLQLKGGKTDICE
jgi:hypothetical protein